VSRVPSHYPRPRNEDSVSTTLRSYPLVIVVLLSAGCRDGVPERLPPPGSAWVRFIPEHGALVPLGTELGLEGRSAVLPTDPPPDQIGSLISLMREIRAPGRLDAEVIITTTQRTFSVRIVPVMALDEGQYSIRFAAPITYEPGLDESASFRESDGAIGSRFTISAFAAAK
jgi:hypothetical protein